MTHPSLTRSQDKRPTADSAVPESATQAHAFIPSRRLLVGIMLAVLTLDQVTKAMVHSLLPLHESVAIIPGFLNLTHVWNTGAAFGLLNEADIPYKAALMTAIATVALIAIATFAWRSTSHNPVAQLGLALILGGATGNLIDRITAGYVVDFVDFYWRNWHFWAFNVADSAITVGAGLLILDMVFLSPHVSETV